MPSPSHRFDVFLCHNSLDKTAVREIAQKLWENGIQSWLDERDLRGGDAWIDKLEEQAKSIPSVAVFMGPEGRGPWQQQEWRIFLDQHAKRGCRVIPVLLPGGEESSEHSPFLAQFHTVDFRKTAPDPLVQLVRAIESAEVQVNGDGQPDSQVRIWLVPYPRNSYFTGREEILGQLHERLTQDGTAVLGQTQAISGLGGIGKTQTAVEYAYRYRNEYQAIFFVRADTEAEILKGFGEIARRLGLGEATDQELVVEAVLGWLEANEGWLLIFDNADELEVVKPHLPRPAHRGQVLLTSRAQVFHGLGIRRPFHMPPLPPNEAVLFLLTRSEREEEELEEDESSACEQLAEELGYLPLALEQAGSYVLAKQSRFQDYLAGYRKRGLELLGRGEPQGHDPVEITWSLNFQEVEETSPPSAELLRASAFLSPDEIPLEILTKGADHLGPILSEALAGTEEDRLLIDEILEPLTRYSLVSRNVGLGTYSVHRIVQQVSRRGMETPDQQAWGERIVLALNKAFPDPEFAFWPLCDQLVPHVQVVEHLTRALTVELAAPGGRLFNQCGVYLGYRARYSEAEPLYQRSLEIKEKALGKDHPELATTLNNLANLYTDQGRLAEAEPLYQRSLEITEKALGKDHPELATTLNNLALLYTAQGRLAEAEPLYQRSLEITEKALGKDHPSLATTLNNLANLYKAQGRLAEAEPLYQRDLEITEKALGKDHPDFVQGVRNYAAFLRETDREQEAVELEERAGLS